LSFWIQQISYERKMPERQFSHRKKHFESAKKNISSKSVEKFFFAQKSFFEGNRKVLTEDATALSNCKS